jgi:hypothetical protein
MPVRTSSLYGLTFANSWSQKRAHRPLSTLEPLSYHVPPRTNTKRPISEPISKGTVRCDESGRIDLISTNASNQKKKKLKNKE